MKEKKKEEQTVFVQTAPSKSHPFGAVDRYVPLMTPEARLYASLAEGIPIISAAIQKTVRLVGGFKVECNHPAAEKGLQKFLNSVRVGSCSQGIDAFISQYLEQMMLYGTGIGEIILDKRTLDIAGLYNASVGDVELVVGDDPLTVDVCRREGARAVPVPRPDLILLSAHDPTPERPFGTSVLWSLPFVSSVLLKIYNTEKINFDRVGNLRFAVTCKPPEGGVGSRERAQMIASEWSKAMRSDGTVSDFVAMGDVDIRVIGADSQVLDCEVPARQMLEQIVAKMGIPPFMLGLSWSSTERMSSQQADMLTSELEAYRRVITPVINRICSLWLNIHGFSDEHSVVWDNISLLDETELARAELYRMQARQIEHSLRAKGE